MTSDERHLDRPLKTVPSRLGLGRRRVGQELANDPASIFQWVLDMRQLMLGGHSCRQSARSSADGF